MPCCRSYAGEHTALRSQKPLESSFQQCLRLNVGNPSVVTACFGKNAKISPRNASSTNPVVRAGRCPNLCLPSFHQFPSLPLSFRNEQSPNKPPVLLLILSLLLGLRPRLLVSGCLSFLLCSHIGQHGQPLFQRNLVLHQPARTLSCKHSLHLDRAVLRSSFD